MMPVLEFHREVASIALGVAAPHGFALGGGNALIAHGIVSRLTEDVDLFTDKEDGVARAAEAVQSALSAAGLQANRQDKTGGLSDIFEGMGDQLAEWTISRSDGAQTILQMAYIERHNPPVTMPLGPSRHGREADPPTPECARDELAAAQDPKCVARRLKRGISCSHARCH